MWKAIIDGVDRRTDLVMPPMGGVTIELPLNERPRALFLCKNGFIPSLRDEVVIYDQDGITPIFGGIIHELDTKTWERYAWVAAECVGFDAYTTWRTVTGGYVGPELEIASSGTGSPGTITTAVPHGLVTGDTVYFVGHDSTPALDEASYAATVTGANTFTIPVSVTVAGGAVGTVQRLTVVNLKRVLQDLLLHGGLSEYGVTLDPAQVDGPTGAGPGLAWEDATLDTVLRDLSDLSGGYMRTISPLKVLSMSLPDIGTETAPFSITDTNQTARQLSWSMTNANYGTRVVLKCGGTGTRALRQVWTVDAAISAAGYVETTASSTPTGGVRAWVTPLFGSRTELTVGASGQQLVWDWATHRLSPGTYTPVLGDEVELEYTAQFPFTVTADAGVTPPLVRLFEEPDITDVAVGQALADARLLTVHQDPRSFKIDTVVPGLRPGQVIAIDSSSRAATSTHAIIDHVTITLNDNEFWEYEATALEGLYQGSHLDYWRGRQAGASGGGGVSAATVTYTGGINPTIEGQPLTKVDDTNVTLALGGSPTTALLAASSLTLGWTGTLAAARLNANVVQSVVNDANITGSIASQVLTLGFNGPLPKPRGGTGLTSLAPGLLPYGAGTSPLASSTRLTFDGTALNSHSVNVTTGNATFAAGAHPVLNYHSNLGSINRKYLSAHIAELWADTLVAAEVMSTIGGQILVAPTTELQEDLSSSATTIVTKHNNLAVGDLILLKAFGRVEWMEVTSGPSAGVSETHYHPLVGLTSHGEEERFEYGVDRNVDGTGANQWYAGNAVVNTGVPGDGFIDIYSVSGVLSGFGPSIVGNVRTGTTHSAIEPRWAIGNLRDVLAEYSVDTYGAFFGVPTAAWIKIDPTNGIRIGHNATTKVHIDAAGNATFAGALSAATGTFAGALSAATGTFAGSLSAATGTFAGSLSAATGTFSGTVSVGQVVIDVNGIRITPSTAWDNSRAYRFDVATGNFGLYGSEADASFGRAIDLTASWSGTGNYTNGVTVQLDANHAPASGGTTRRAYVRLNADGTDGTIELFAQNGQVLLTTPTVTTDASIQGLTGPLSLSTTTVTGVLRMAAVPDFNLTHTGTTASAGAATLPSNPAGFLHITVDSTAYRIPVYNT